MTVHQIPKIYHPEFAIPGTVSHTSNEIDWDNEITEGLSFLVTTGERNIVADEFATSIRQVEVPNDIGIASETASGVGSEQMEFADSIATQLDGPFTLFAYFEDEGVDGTNPSILARRTSFANGNAEMFFSSSTGKLSIFTRHSDTNFEVEFSGLTARGSFSGPIFVAVSCNSSGSIGVLKQFRKGVEVDTGAAITASSDGTQKMVIGGFDDVGSAHTFGKKYEHGAFKRSLPLAELIDLANDPGQLLLAENLVYFTPDAAPPAGTTVILTGQESTSEQGSVTPTGAALTILLGQESETVQGVLTLSGAANVALLGQQSSAEQGAITLDIGPLIVQLSGQSSVSEQGIITPKGAALVSILGQESSAQQGVVTVTAGEITVTLVGQESTSEQGTLSLAIEAIILLEGQQADVRQGVLRIAGDIRARTMTDWIQQQPGLTGTSPDRWNQFLTIEGFSVGTLPDRMYKWFASQGFTNDTISGRQMAWADVNLETDAPI